MEWTRGHRKLKQIIFIFFALLSFFFSFIFLFRLICTATTWLSRSIELSDCDKRVPSLFGNDDEILNDFRSIASISVLSGTWTNWQRSAMRSKLFSDCINTWIIQTQKTQQQQQAGPRQRDLPVELSIKRPARPIHRSTDLPIYPTDFGALPRFIWCIPAQLTAATSIHPNTKYKIQNTQ